MDGLNCLEVICGENRTVLVVVALFVIEPGRDIDCVGDWLSKELEIGEEH